MTITHKKAAQILQNWNLENETITDIYYEGTSNKNDSACYVGEAYVLKYTPNLSRLKKNIEVSKALESIGLLSAVPVLTNDGAEYIPDGELYFYLTKRLPGKQMISHSFGKGDGRYPAFGGIPEGISGLAQGLRRPRNFCDLLPYLVA